MESGIQSYGIQNRDQVLHEGMKYRIQVSLEKTEIQNRWNGIQNPRLAKTVLADCPVCLVLDCERRITIFPLFTFH